MTKRKVPTIRPKLTVPQFQRVIYLLRRSGVRADELLADRIEADLFHATLNTTKGPKNG